jgi:hypothetical protein
MSYHLRQLAKWKIVEEVESTDGRERRWMHLGGWGIEPDHPNAAIAAGTILVARVLDRQREDILRWFATRGDEMPEWLDAAT